MYSKATVVKQAMSSGEEKVPQDEHAVEKMNEELFKDFEWDPSSLIPGQLSLGDVPASSMSPLTQILSLAPSASLSALFKLADPARFSHLTHIHLSLSETNWHFDSNFQDIFSGWRWGSSGSLEKKLMKHLASRAMGF